MRPQGSSASPALWVLGCLTLLLWLWVLCTACHRRRAGRQVSRLQGMQGGGMPAKASLLRPPHLCSLSKSDTRLHELCRGQPCSRAPRPASVDLLCPQWLEVSRGMTRPPEAFSVQELPAAVPFTDPEATYSNVGLAVIPRARLAFGSGVWAGAHSCARLGPEARPAASEYACIQKLKGTGRVPQGLGQGRTEVIPANQVDSLYSKVSKPKRRDPGPASDQPDPKGGGTVLALGGDLAYEALPPKSVGVNRSFLENVYESIQEMGGPGASKLELLAGGAIGRPWRPPASCLLLPGRGRGASLAGSVNSLPPERGAPPTSPTHTAAGTGSREQGCQPGPGCHSLSRAASQ
ncbi:lck-interacting transmembrane adapter 1 isoform X3 [Phacochoerus africanus]|uniref:lck-interacting transmembrane adapter 1 isoform X3 n=1 Tax=Phacochoerus africanus TaxID=41426 RepID=UPI001FD9ACB5|nr:lck-interacting transmembrane adapter 1 isoform X3 [Phacochoerus africanus]